MAAGIPPFLWLTRGAAVAEASAPEPRVREAEAAG
jgi:hypothetical protein